MFVMIVPCAEKQIDLAGDTLAQAFLDDPLQTYIFPDPKERREKSVAQFSTLVRYGNLIGDVFTNAAVDGVAVWMPPEPRTHPDPLTASGMTHLPRVMGAEAHLRFGRVLDYLSSVHGAGMPPRAFYLMIVGVVPVMQHRGLGQQLLAPILSRAASEGVPCCLDTSQPANRRFYEQLGFRVVFESTDPTSGVHFWTYQR